MKKLMVFCMAALFVASVASAQLAEVKIGKGDLKIGAILQGGFQYDLAEGDPKNYVDENDNSVYYTSGLNNQFTLNRARLLFWGTVCPDKVKYFIQTEANQKTGSDEGVTYVATPYILDFKMIFLNYIPNTSITVGRFLPNFTLYMPAPTSRLDMINYPLLVTGGSYSVLEEYEPYPYEPPKTTTSQGAEDHVVGSCSVPGYAMWRQCGLQSATATEYVDFNVGLFNGPTNNLKDNNDAKDVLLRAGFKPKTDFAKVTIGGYAWLGNLLLSEKEDKAYNRFGFFGVMDHEKAAVKAEFVMGSNEDGYTHNSTVEDLKSMGFYGHAEYKVNEQFGVLGRFDHLDPNTDGDAKADAWTWITFGVNHYIDSWNAMIYLNYIMKMEQDDWGATETIKNDVVMLQFQVAP